MGLNQGPSSNETPYLKQATQMPPVQNKEGAESTETTLISAPTAYHGPTGNDGINGTASTEDLSAKWQRPHPQDVSDAGKNQYQ